LTRLLQLPGRKKKWQRKNPLAIQILIFRHF